MKQITGVLLTILFGWSQAMACISLTRTERNFEITGQQGEGYGIRMTTREYDQNDEPMGPETTTTFVDDDYYFLSQMVINDIQNNSDTASQRQGALTASMQGYTTYVNNSMIPYIRSQGATSEQISEIERLNQEIAQLSQSGNSDVSALATQYRDKLRELTGILSQIGSVGIAHGYDADNGERIDYRTLNPPATRSIGCTSGLEIGVNLGDFNPQAEAAAAAAADPFTGLGVSVNEN